MKEHFNTVPRSRMTPCGAPPPRRRSHGWPAEAGPTTSSAGPRSPGLKRPQYATGARRPRPARFVGRASARHIGRNPHALDRRLGFGQPQPAGDQAGEQGVAEGGEGLGLLLVLKNAAA